MNTPKSIIVIDDDKDDQEILSIAISELRVTDPVLFFDTGQEAIEYLKSCENRPGLIICDINMPGMNGVEVKEIINNEIPCVRHVPFIFLSTASDQKRLINDYNHLNVQGYFRKPCSFMDYINTVKKILNY